ncbi:MAG TPA: aldehyde dehydrogenase family protein [Candidatus Binataceae bacterium]|nr:aldehyde dehydrogenase family protein [Candidatus Binataceae bacterium]
MAAAVPSVEPATEAAAARRFLQGPPKQLLIGGKWVPAKSGKTFETINPANEEVLALVAEGDRADIDEAVAAARRAFEAGRWPSLGPHQRARYLLRIADLIEQHADELAQLITLDNGKPISEATVEVGRTVDTFRYYAGWATKFYGETNPSAPDFFNYTLREPVGVCGQIIPWNGPLSTISWKVAPALAFGNTLVLKPAEQTPLPAVRMGELICEAGLPDGVVNIVTGFGPTAGAALAGHPDVDKVAFTGSTEVGKLILQASAGNLKRVSLELGGKSPNVIFADAPLETAVALSATGVFRNQGQVCCAATRMFVQESLYDEFAERIAAKAEAIRLGEPLDQTTTMGPLVSSEQYERVLGYLKLARDEGAQAKAGGERGPQERGYFVKPTIYTAVRNDMRIAREEIFGPVAVLIPFKDENDAVLQGNDTTYGLGAGVWTRDLSRAHRVARALRAGSVWVNCYGLIDPISAFGGYKQSGFGRELGPQSIDLYTQIKSVYVKL